MMRAGDVPARSVVSSALARHMPGILLWVCVLAVEGAMYESDDHADGRSAPDSDLAYDLRTHLADATLAADLLRHAAPGVLYH
jgi:hypothetical protein